MQKKGSFWSVFLVVLFLCVLILALSLSGKLKFLSFLEKPAAAIQSLSYNSFHKLPFVSQDAKIKKLEEANLELLSRVSDFERLKKENQALLDQFRTAYPVSYNLLKADVIGAPSFVPGVSTPNSFIINKGQKDNLKIGSAVVVKDNLVGVVSKISVNLSQVNTVNHPLFSLTAKTQNGAVGVIKGGSSLTIDNILLSENITKGEFVLTKGDVDSDGVGIPPDLVVGKVTSVEKNPSDLFQKAKIESFVNFINLSAVFVYMQIE